MDNNTQTVARTIETIGFEEGDWKGFKYCSPVHAVTPEKTTVEVSTGLAEALNFYGEAIILNLFDAQVLSRIRTKVKNALPKAATPTELAAKQQELLAKHPGGILFTSEEALAWKPDMRELSPNQLLKKAKEAFSAATKETDPSKKLALLAEGQGYLAKMGQVLMS